MASVQGRIRIPLARYGTPGKDGSDGEDAVTLVPSTYTVTFTESMNTVEVLFSAYQGETLVTINSMGTSGSVSGVTVSQTQHTDGTMTYSFYRANPSAVINGTVDFTGRIVGGTLTGAVSRTVTLRFESVADGEDGEDGEGSYYLKPDKDTVVFTPESNTAQVTFTAYCGSEKISGREPYVRADTRLDGVSYSFGSVSGGTFTMTIARTDDTVQVNGTMVVCLEVDLPDGNTMDISGSVAVLTNDGTPDAKLSTDIVCFKESGSQFVYVTGTRGGMQVSLSESQVSVSPSSGAVWSVAKAQVGQRVELEVAYSGGAAKVSVGEEVTVTTTIGGVDIVKTFRIQTNFDGDPGKDGDPGEDAVTYELSCAYSTVKYNGAAGAFAPESISVALYQVKGADRALYDGNVDWRLLAEYVGDTDSSGKQVQREVDTSDGNSWTIVLAQYVGRSYGTGYYSRLLVRAVLGAEQLEHSVEVTWSAMPRIQVWGDCSASFRFESGQAGEQFMDFVYYTIEGNDSPDMYQCTSSHVKSSTTPDKDTSHWDRVNYFNNVATQVLLATTAKIDNLFCDDVFMSNNETALWLNPAIEGLKIVKKSMLVGDGTREEQTATGAAWSNPTAWFSAGKNPTVEEMFGGTGEVSVSNVSVALGTSTFYPTPNRYEGGWASPKDEVMAYTRIGTNFPQNSFVTITQTTVGASNFKMREGSIAGELVESDPEKFKSSLYIELRYSDNAEFDNYAVIATCRIATSDGTDTGRPYSYADFGAIPTMTFYDEWSAGARFLQIVLRGSKLDTAGGNIGFRYNGSTSTQTNLGRGSSSTSTSYTAHVFTVSSYPTGYVARYTAEGIFLGLTANSYARFALSESEVSHALMASGNGLIIDEGRTLQRQSGNALGMPLGGTLLNAYLELNRSNQIRGRIWTWDGSEPTALTYSRTGTWGVTLPYSAWVPYIGSLSTENIGAVATVVGTGHACVRDLVDNQVVICIYDADGELTDDRPVFLHVFYIGVNAFDMVST